VAIKAIKNKNCRILFQKKSVVKIALCAIVAVAPEDNKRIVFRRAISYGFIC